MAELRTVYSIGHGNRSLPELLSILKVHGITCAADVRSYPHSARNPHFNREVLETALPEAGISYVWLKELGGYRKKGLGAASPHVAVESEGFRNYADHMSTPEFRGGVARLLDLAKNAKLAFMCAETLPFRCHRLFLSDYLLVQGVTVLHIVDEAKTMAHELSKLARVHDGAIIYDRTAPEQLKMF